MQTKELLYGLIGFFIGGFLVAVAAHTFNNAELQRESHEVVCREDDSHTHRQ